MHFDTTMIGTSYKMQEVKNYLLKVAATDCNVLITGETGTGKELAAEMIHQKSKRSSMPFVSINCTALPESLFESELFGYERGAFTGAYSSYAGKLQIADGGTIFFDEIGDMNLYAQAKILRIIEGKDIYRLGGKKEISMNIRIIAATNHDIEYLLREGRFRQDLYFRLNVARVQLPPLRERKEEILPLIEHYIQHFNRKYDWIVEGLTVDALTSMLHYDWPGNVRELKNLLEAAFINLPSRQIDLKDMPKIFREKLKESEKLLSVERDNILSALMANDWNKSKTAHKLKWSRMTLYRKMAKHRIVAEHGP